jgi:hypothetical protein
MRLREDGQRRRGLMLGIDLRMHFLSAGAGTFLQPMLCIGHEAF